MKDWLLQGFEYDRWANRRWLPVLPPLDVSAMDLPAPWPGFPDGPAEARAADVFVHLVWAQRTWIRRCFHDVEPAEPTIPAWIETLHEAWMERLRSGNPDERITYRNSSGTEFNSSLGEIALHVINHGTYHRGQVREILEGRVQVPETDLFLFFMERKG